MSPNEVFKLAISKGYNHRCFMCHEVDALHGSKLITEDDYVDAINDIEHVMSNFSDRIAAMVNGEHEVPRHHYTVMSNVIYDLIVVTRWNRGGRVGNPFENSDNTTTWKAIYDNLIVFYGAWDDREEILTRMIEQLGD